MNYVIDGLFLTQKITGIQRYAIEICRELDKIIGKNEIEILVPEQTKDLPEYQNIKIVLYGSHTGRAWEQIDLMHYLKQNKKEGLFLTNEVPLLYAKGIACIHDISYKVNPSYFSSLNKRISRLWHCINYSAITKNCRKILTVSEFSKSEIIRVYHVESDRISVINNSWQQMQEIKEDESIINDNDFLKGKNYYFSMSTLAPNKNFKWVLAAAKQNPDRQFAIAGGGRLEDVANEYGYSNLPNIHFLGYVSDGEAKALMKHCLAFLFPTLYEGFGIPPMEAAASGCKSIVVSDIECMHEVYGNDAYYVDPKNYNDINLNAIDGTKDARNVLQRYSWSRSADKLLHILRSI